MRFSIGYHLETPNPRSMLRFTAGRDAVTEMQKSPGTHWQGNMTVVLGTNP